jgi:hypothetical protein
MKMKAVLAALFALLFSSGAQAVPQHISGVYVLSIVNLCQLTIFADRNEEGAVVALSPLPGANFMTFENGTATFNINGTVKLVLRRIEGSMTLFQNEGGPPSGQALSIDSETTNSSYSLAAASFTLGGQVYQAWYSDIRAGGVPWRVDFQRKGTGAESKCMLQGTASRRQ